MHLFCSSLEMYIKTTIPCQIMSKDLAIDVGLPPDSEEFEKFVNQVDSILKYGCSSTTRGVQDLVEKCHTSELDIARQVIRACGRNPTNINQSKLKWWETYGASPSQRSRTVPSSQRGRASPHQRRRSRGQQPVPQRRRSMSPLFEHQHRPRSPSRQHRQQHGSNQSRPVPEQRHHRRPMNMSFERRKTARSRGSSRGQSRNERRYDQDCDYDRNREDYNRGRSRGQSRHERRYDQDCDYDHNREDYNSVDYNRGRSRGQSRNERRYDPDFDHDHNKDDPRDDRMKRSRSPLFDNASDVPTWPQSKRRRHG